MIDEDFLLEIGRCIGDLMLAKIVVWQDTNKGMVRSILLYPLCLLSHATVLKQKDQKNGSPQ
jgi:hypothetical protein